MIGTRRDFMRLGALLAGSGFACDDAEATLAAARQATNGGVPAARFDSNPVLMAPGSDAVTIAVAVRGLCTAWIECCDGERFDAARARRVDGLHHGLQPLSARLHRVRVHGLEAGRTYCYRVAIASIDFRGPYAISRGEAIYSAVHAFSTLDDGAGPRASFAVINDTHEKVDTLTALTGLLADKRHDVLFWNGDVFDDVRSDDQIVANLLRPPARNPEAESYAASRPLAFVCGNHDVRGIEARSLDRFVDTPGGLRHYVLRQGPVAFIVLDTGEDKPDDHPVYAGLGAFDRYRSAQRIWLAKAIEEPLVREASFRVAVMHIPLFGKAASERSRKAFHDLFVAGRIDVAIHGHVHEYLYSPPDADRPYPQLVGGGPALASATLVEGEATDAELRLVVRAASGGTLAEHRLAARS